MAGLVGSHPLDCVRVCQAPSCGRLADCRYNGAQILDTEDGRIVEWRYYTCQACGSTFLADAEDRPGAQIGTVTDRREWHRARQDATGPAYDAARATARAWA